MRDILRAASAAGLAIVASLTLASSALAITFDFGGYKYIRQGKEMKPATTRVITASCPPKMHVLGGGPQASVDALHLYASSSYPFDGSDQGNVPDDGWKIRFTSYDEDAAPMTWAVCARVGVHYSSRRYEIASGQTRANTAVDCGGQRRIVSGGFQSAVGVRPSASYPSDAGASGDSWVLTIYNPTGGKAEVTGFAACVDFDIAYAGDAGSPQSAPPEEYYLAESQCPGGMPNPIGGGFLTSFEGSNAGLIHVQESSPGIAVTPGAWVVTLDSTGTTDPGLLSWGSCAPNR